MKELICTAIKNRKVIQFTYENQIRIVEPFVIGNHRDTNNLVMRSYRAGGYSKSEREPNWRLFDVSLISNLSITDTNAADFREYYNPQDKHMSRIICNV